MKNVVTEAIKTASSISGIHSRTLTTQKSYNRSAFTLVEMLMALLIVSVILSASLPIISQRQKAMASSYNQNRNFPIGGVILWTDMSKLPDNTWMECNGTAIPNGVEYEQARRIFGANTPDLRNTFAYSTNLNNYLKTDLKNYLQTNLGVIPQNLIAIWGTTASIPSGWSEATEYRGVFLRGYGSITNTQNNGSTIGNTATTHSSGAIGAVQGDAMRHLYGTFDINMKSPWYAVTCPGCDGGGGIFTGRGNGGNAYTLTEFGYVSGGYNANFLLDSSRVTPVSFENRPINKAVRYIKYTNTSSFPDLPEPPSTTSGYRFIAKVRY